MDSATSNLSDTHVRAGAPSDHRSVDVRARDATAVSGRSHRESIGLLSSISRRFLPSLFSSQRSDGAVRDPAPVNSHVAEQPMLVRSHRTCSPVVVTPRGAGIPSLTRELAILDGILRIGTSQRRSDRSDPVISNQISTSVSRCQSQAPMPSYYGPSGDHQYHIYATVSHPHLPYQHLPVTVVAGSSAVYRLDRPQ